MMLYNYGEKPACLRVGSEEYEKDALEEIAQMGEGGSLEKIHTRKCVRNGRGCV